MSDRGKCGNGLVLLSPKRQRKDGADAYEWKEGEEVVLVSYANDNDNMISTFCIPKHHVHALLHSAVENNAKYPHSHIEISIGTDDPNSDVFDWLTTKEFRTFYDQGFYEDKDDDELDSDEREEVLSSISEWCITLEPWRKDPPTAVKITCRISVYEIM